MEFLLVFVLFIISCVLCYSRGYAAGNIANVKGELEKATKFIPINIKISMIGDIYYANLLILGTFLGQDKSRDNLVKRLVDQFPDRMIITCDVDESKDD